MKQQDDAKPGEKGQREKEPALPTGKYAALEVVCRHPNGRSGLISVSFSALGRCAPEPVRALIWAVLNDKARRMQSASWAYSIAKVFAQMAEYCAENNWSLQIGGNAKEEIKHLKRIKHSFYERCKHDGIRLGTTNSQWGDFLAIMRALAGKGILRGISIKDRSIRREYGIRPKRSEFAATEKSLSTPKSMNHAADSYNSDLLEPIPISASTESFLEEYENKLRFALESIKKAALEDLSAFVDKRRDGAELLASVDYEAIRRTKSVWRRKFIDPENGLHFFRLDDHHPNLLANHIALYTHEMDGVPQLPKRYSDNRHWLFLNAYPRDIVLPYLGIPSIYEALACVVVLLIEHPKLNVQSLINGELSDVDGADRLILDADLEGSAGLKMRITVSKWRAVAEKSSVLSNVARDSILTYLDITEATREKLKAEGRFEEANFIWIGFEHYGRNYKRYMLSNFYNAFTENEVKGVKPRTTLPFFVRHPELQRWEDTSLKAIRVNSGVQKFLQSGGSLAIAADVFGHASIRTTVQNYIPEALLQLIYERQIRRQQNLVIVRSHPDQDVRLQATDFASVEKLHEFLGSGIGPITFAATVVGENADAVAQTVKALNDREGRVSELYLVDDASSVAVALLYREHLRKAPVSFLGTADPVTRLTPQFWADLIDTLSSDLPPAYYPVRTLFDRAKLLMPHIAATTSFREFW